MARKRFWFRSKIWIGKIVDECLRYAELVCKLTFQYWMVNEKVAFSED